MANKIYTDEEIRKLWPQAADELRGFQNALARNAGLTAELLGMALQLADREFQRLASNQVQKRRRENA